MLRHAADTLFWDPGPISRGDDDSQMRYQRHWMMSLPVQHMWKNPLVKPCECKKASTDEDRESISLFLKISQGKPVWKSMIGQFIDGLIDCSFFVRDRQHQIMFGVHTIKLNRFGVAGHQTQQVLPKLLEMLLKLDLTDRIRLRRSRTSGASSLWRHVLFYLLKALLFAALLSW